MTYHLHTEACANLETLVSQHFPEGATLIPSIGFWHSAREVSTIIELDTEDSAAVIALAEAIKLANKQEAVLIERYNSTVSFLV